MSEQVQSVAQRVPDECPECRSEEDFTAEPGFWYCEGCGASWTFEPSAPAAPLASEVSAQGQTGPTTQDEALAEVIEESWMRPEHDRRCDGSPDLCARYCPSPWMADAGLDDMRLDAARAVLAAGYLPPAEVERQITAARVQAWDEAARWVDDNDPGWGEQVREANPYRADTEGNR